MNKELKNLLDNYENVIYGKAFPINPSTHQLHLLLDYIANLGQQVREQKEVIEKIVYKIENYTTLNEPRIRKELLDILNEVSE